CGQGTHLTL
nr:immunoglobulin light chain junction region [Macaca mulatta]MOW64742.1 immunoglobulin light chain junction region [Macaca mulatta]